MKETTLPSSHDLNTVHEVSCVKNVKLSEPDESSPHPSNLFLHNINIINIILSITLDSSRHLHDQVLPQKVLGTFISRPGMHATYPIISF